LEAMFYHDQDIYTKKTESLSPYWWGRRRRKLII